MKLNKLLLCIILVLLGLFCWFNEYLMLCVVFGVSSALVSSALNNRELFEEIFTLTIIMFLVYVILVYGVNKQLLYSAFSIYYFLVSITWANLIIYTYLDNSFSYFIHKIEVVGLLFLLLVLCLIIISSGEALAMTINEVTKGNVKFTLVIIWISVLFPFISASTIQHSYCWIKKTSLTYRSTTKNMIK